MERALRKPPRPVRSSIVFLLAASALLADPRQLLTGTAVDDKATVTADGRLMTMTDWSSGDLAIRDLSTGTITRLMAKPGGWESDDFGELNILSPDQRQVVYLWYEGGRNPYLRVMPNQPGAKSRVLVRNPEFSYVLPAAWSHDGKSILVTLWKQDYTAQLAWVSAVDGSFKVLRSLEWRRPGRPSLSPDGRYIAYAAVEQRPDPANVHIYVLAADGSSETEIAKDTGVNEAPLWTPDGARLLFTSNHSGNFNLWSVAMRDGKAVGAPSLATADIGKILPIGLTRTGSFYYVRDRGGENIWIGKADGSAVKLTEKSAGSNRAPAWSPDGKFIAFKRRSSAVGYDLVIHAVESGEEKTYASSSMVGAPTRPVWFKDGKSVLLAMSDNQNKISFHRVDLKTGEFTEVVPADPSYLGMSALYNKTIYIAVHDDKKNTGGVVAVDIASGQQRPVFTAPGFVNNFALSPEGLTLAIARSAPGKGHWEGRLSRVGVDGTNPHDLYGVDKDIFGGGPMLAWSKDSILFGQGEREWQLMRIPADGGTPEPTGLTTTGLRHDISVSPDGAHVAYGEGKYSVKETWVLDNLK